VILLVNVPLLLSYVLIGSKEISPLKGTIPQSLHAADHALLTSFLSEENQTPSTKSAFSSRSFLIPSQLLYTEENMGLRIRRQDLCSVESDQTATNHEFDGDIHSATVRKLYLSSSF